MKTGDPPRIRRDDADGLTILTIDRPEKLNALDTASFEALDAHLDALETAGGTIGCVILRGAGRSFCAGADLDVMGKAPVSPAFKPGVIDRLARLPQPVIAAVHGHCLTGGLELALACDLIVADATAKLADTHGKWGLVAAWGMAQRLQRRTGTAFAKRMMLTGDMIGAETAMAAGLVDLIAPEGEATVTAQDVARRILANSWHSNFAAKRMMREGEGRPLDEALAQDRAHYPGNAPDHADRVARFTSRTTEGQAR